MPGGKEQDFLDIEPNFVKVYDMKITESSK